MDKQAMLDDYIDAKGFKQVMNDERLNMSMAVRVNLAKAKWYKRQYVEFISHPDNELLVDKALKANQQRNYYVWNAIEVARFEFKHGINLIDNYDDFRNMLVTKYGVIKDATLSELKLLMLMEHYRSELLKERIKQE